MKKLMIIGFLMLITLTLSSCVENDKYVKRDVDPVEMTLAEVSEFDGLDGMDAYIVVNGVIYDVTSAENWENGTHNGVVAGTDATEAITNAPHGEGVLDDLTVIGTIVEEQSGLLMLTLEELSVYNGSNGMDAYIAYNGDIYDVTNVSAWNGGEHHGYEAGQDVTNIIGDSPHGVSVIDNLTKVGEVIE